MKYLEADCGDRLAVKKYFKENPRTAQRFIAVVIMALSLIYFLR